MRTYKLTPRDRLDRAAARLLARLSDRTARRLAGKPITVDGQTLDPHIQLALKALERTGHGGRGPGAGAEAARRESRRASLVSALPIPRVEEVSDLTLPGPAGQLRARIYRALGTTARGRSPRSSSSTAAAG